MRRFWKAEMSNRSDDIQQSDNQFGSIENVHIQQLQSFFRQHNLEELIAQNKLKKIGLQTAEALIKALYEQVKRLQGQNYHIRNELKQIQSQFSNRERQMSDEISYLKKKMISKGEKRSFRKQECMEDMILPECTKRYLSYEVKNRENIEGSPIRKMSAIQTVSKEYVQTVRESEKYNQLYQEAKIYMLGEQLDNILLDYESLNQLINLQKQDLNIYNQQFRHNQLSCQQLEKQIISTTSTKPHYSNSLNSIGNKTNKRLKIKGKKLFSTQLTYNDNSPETLKLFQRSQRPINQQISQNSQTLSSITKQYEEIIQQYKQYSAYLKAYLCSCIGYIHKETQEMQQKNYYSRSKYSTKEQSIKSLDSQESDGLSTDRSVNMFDFPSNQLFPVVLRDILFVVQEKLLLQKQKHHNLSQQNSQLKTILDQLISNLKKSNFPGISNYPQTNNITSNHHRSTKTKQKPYNKNQTLKKNKEISINLNKPIIHRMTLTEANNFYHPLP